MSQLLREHEALVRSELADESTLQLGQLGAQLASSEVGQDRWIGCTCDQGGEDLPTRDAEDIGGHVAELDVGAFQSLLDPIDFGSALADERGPIARQLA